jgi:PTH1 family peptidyl-tRNA hydrolase
MSLDDLLVVHDEVDVPFAHMKFQRKRGHGGHNGIRNIHQMLGSDDYGRLRLGVSRPPVFVGDDGEKRKAVMETHEWVLNNFSKDEIAKMPDFLNQAIKGAEVWCAKGIQAASTEFNK